MQQALISCIPLTPLAGCGAATTLPLHEGHMAIVLIQEPEHAAGRWAKAPAGADMECPST